MQVGLPDKVGDKWRGKSAASEDTQLGVQNLLQAAVRLPLRRAAQGTGGASAPSAACARFRWPPSASSLWGHVRRPPRGPQVQGVDHRRDQSSASSKATSLAVAQRAVRHGQPAVSGNSSGRWANMKRTAPRVASQPSRRPVRRRISVDGIPPAAPPSLSSSCSGNCRDRGRSCAACKQSCRTVCRSRVRQSNCELTPGTRAGATDLGRPLPNPGHITLVHPPVLDSPEWKLQ
ncbi:hypothetical protein CTU88_40600 [Streptomyces sp. JV178]|nr:hypothetical protein CTU88_40600 [Streptomyces sp. JV178]